MQRAKEIFPRVIFGHACHRFVVRALGFRTH